MRSEQRTGPGSGRRGEPLTPQEQPGDRSASETIRTAGLDPRGLQRVLVVLCVTEITSWGVLYYALPVLAPAIAADTGWSIPGVTGAFSAGLVVSALVGVPVGRWLDRIGPRLVMTAGSVLAVPAVAMIALAGTFPVFVVRRPEHEPTVLAPVHVLIVYTRSELGVVTRVLVSRSCFQIG